jgi:hypothetical protein
VLSTGVMYDAYTPVIMHRSEDLKPLSIRLREFHIVSIALVSTMFYIPRATLRAPFRVAEMIACTSSLI